jgi:hypothetical protein
MFDGAGTWCRDHADAGRPWCPPPSRSQPKYHATPTPVRAVPTDGPPGFARFLAEAGTAEAWARVAPPRALEP